MSELSTILSLPYIQPSQAQKHVTHNEALRLLDVITQISVIDRDQFTPPAAPTLGQRHIVPAGATGDWNGQDGSIAAWLPEGWAFFIPQAGWAAWIVAEAGISVYDGAAWGDVIVPPSSIDALDMLGINASADAVNRLTVAAGATLLNHDGADHLLKINKAATGDTASLLFQNGFLGRAEIGLAGNDDFSVKVSADGSAWTTAMTVDAATGVPSFPAGGVRPALGGDTTWYVDPVQGNDANDGLSAGTGAFATIQRAVDAATEVDGGANVLTIQLADGSYALGSDPITLRRRLIGTERLFIVGNTATPANVSITSDVAVFVVEGARLSLQGMQISSAGANKNGIEASSEADVIISDVDFGTVGWAHMFIDDARIEAVGSYSISGGATYHVRVETCGVFRGKYVGVTLTGTPAFATSFASAGELSLLTYYGASFTGAATGKRYNATRGALINVGGGGATFLPGDLAGTVNSDAYYG